MAIRYFSDQSHYRPFPTPSPQPPPVLDQTVIAAVVAVKMNEARNNDEENACMGRGGGAFCTDEARKLAEFYYCGLRQEVPPDWKKLYDKLATEFEKRGDPEYQEYLRLRNKFE